MELKSIIAEAGSRAEIVQDEVAVPQEEVATDDTVAPVTCAYFSIIHSRCMKTIFNVSCIRVYIHKFACWWLGTPAVYKNAVMVRCLVHEVAFWRTGITRIYSQ